MKITKLIIPTAGLGTRMLPATKALPKEMLPIVNKPVIQYIVEEAVTAGITDIIMVTGYHKRAIEDHFDQSFELNAKLEAAGKNDLLNEMNRISNLANFTYVRQKGPYGTASAINSAKHLINNEPFAVLWGDIIADPDRLKMGMSLFAEKQAPVVCGQIRTEPSDYDTYGYVSGKKIADNIWEVAEIEEKPGQTNKPSDLAILNGYLLTPDIFPIIEKLKPTAKGEYCLIKAISELAKIRKVFALEMTGVNQYDTGNKLEYLKTVAQFALKDPEIYQEFSKFLKTLTI
ncbi:MAG: UTP--glucose-1-phosphate uridylyltransferase [bacterium]